MRLGAYKAKGVCSRDIFSTDEKYCAVRCHDNSVLIESENQELLEVTVKMEEVRESQEGEV